MAVNFATIQKTWQPARSDTFDVYFSPISPDDNESEKLNIMQVTPNSKAFPMTSVEEPVYHIEWENVVLCDGTELPYVKKISDKDYITLTFHENMRWEAHYYLKEWAMSLKKGLGISGDVASAVRRINIVRQNIFGEDVLVSAYGVIPPDTLRLSNTNSNMIVESSVSLKVISVIYQLKKASNDSDKMDFGATCPPPTFMA